MTRRKPGKQPVTQTASHFSEKSAGLDRGDWVPIPAPHFLEQMTFPLPVSISSFLKGGENYLAALFRGRVGA